MEGSRRVAAAIVVVLACAWPAVAGCGNAEDHEEGAAVQTADPERTFAPLLVLPAGERLRPMSARWFVERSVLRLAEDRGCPDRTMAVGHTLPELHNEIADWIYPKGLGRGPTYFRNAHAGNCDESDDERIYTDDLTRPHDPGPRVKGLRPGQGYYLDLVDSARGGPRALGDAAVYGERFDEGDGRVRLAYWILHGAQTAGRDAAREGDWERVDVLLDDAGDDAYVPLAIQTGAQTSGAVDVPWDEAQLAGETHPVVAGEVGTHTLTAVRDGATVCAGCRKWRTWKVVSDARSQPWYGFGGAWGEPGRTSATTGPLGPHGDWPTTYEDHR